MVKLLKLNLFRPFKKNVCHKSIMINNCNIFICDNSYKPCYNITKMCNNNDYFLQDTNMFTLFNNRVKFKFSDWWLISEF